MSRPSPPPAVLAAIVLALVGLATGFLLIGTHQPHAVLAAVGAVGWDGLLVLLAAELGLTLPLAAAWRGLCPPLALPAAVWARMLRDAVGHCLPLTSVGGLVLGTRELIRQGITPAVATAAGAADVTLEFLAQIVFVLVAGLLLLWQQPGTHHLLPMAVALFAAVLLGMLSLVAQRRAGCWLAAMIRRIGIPRQQQASLLGHAAALQQALDALHQAPRRLLAGFVLHLLGWLGSGLALWLAALLLGARLDVPQAVAVEGLLSGLRAAAFFVPAALGVQEGGYLAFGALFGVPAELCLGLSLLRRASALGSGVPVLLAWQARTIGRLRPRLH